MSVLNIIRKKDALKWLAAGFILAITFFYIFWDLGSPEPGLAASNLPNSSPRVAGNSNARPPENSKLESRSANFSADEIDSAVLWIQHVEWAHPRHEFVSFYKRLENSDFTIKQAILDRLQRSETLDSKLLAYRLSGSLKIPVEPPNAASSWREWSEYAGAHFWKGEFEQFEAAASEYVESGAPILPEMLRALVRKTTDESAMPATFYFRIGLWSDYFVAAVILEKFESQHQSIIEALASDFSAEERNIISDKMAKFPTQSARAFAGAFAGSGYKQPDPFKGSGSLSWSTTTSLATSELIRTFQSDGLPKSIPKSTVLGSLQESLKILTPDKLQEGYFLWIIANQIN
jgi:hypothetical protein